MGHWVTLDDDQHVYIGSGGKVLATRGAISSGGGGKERGKALAARSKAAIGKATGKGKPSLKEQADKARAAKGDREERALKLTARAQAKAYQLKKQGNEQAAKIAEGHAGKAYRAYLKPKSDAAFKKTTQQSPATTRAIEHARAAGPTLREQADKARAGKGTAQERAQKIVERGKAIQTRLDQRSVAAGDAKDMDTWASTRGRMAYTNRHVSRVSETAEGPTARIQVASPGKPFKSSTMGQHSDWRSKPGTTLVSKPAQRTLHGDHDSMGDVTSKGPSVSYKATVKKGDVIDEGVVHDVRLTISSRGARQEILVKPHTTASKALLAQKKQRESGEFRAAMDRMMRG